MWIAPFPRWSVLAGRVLDAAGNYLNEVTVEVRSVELVDETLEPVIRFAASYAAESLNGDDEFQENFVFGDLPPGTYTVAVSGRSRSHPIVIPPDGLAWVVLIADDE
jgi:hypothetical protein